MLLFGDKKLYNKRAKLRVIYVRFSHLSKHNNHLHIGCVLIPQHMIHEY